MPANTVELLVDAAAQLAKAILSAVAERKRAELCDGQ